MTSRFEVIDGKRYRRKVRAIIVNERGEFLLIQPKTYQDGRWTFVGGGIEEGEDSKQAIEREINEELGPQELLHLSSAPKRHIYLYSDNYRSKHNVDHDGQVADLFWAEIHSNSIVYVQKSEVKRFKWTTLADVKKLVTVPAQLEMFEGVLLDFSPRYQQKKVS